MSIQLLGNLILTRHLLVSWDYIVTAALGFHREIIIWKWLAQSVWAAVDELKREIIPNLMK